MVKIICNYCGKEIYSLPTAVTVTVTKFVNRLTEEREVTMHFHTECADELRRLVNQHAKEVQKKQDEGGD